MDRARHQNALAPGAGRGQERGLGERGRAVVERRVGDVHPGQLRDQGLKLEDDGERPLGDLGLVRRVGGVELGAEAEVVHRRGHEMVVDAGAEERAAVSAVTVPGRKPLDEPGDFELALGSGQAERLLETKLLRHRRQEIVERRDPDRPQHRLLFTVPARNVGESQSSAPPPRGRRRHRRP